MNLFQDAYPELAELSSTSCELEVASVSWPPVVGEYFVLCENKNCQVAVSTLASVSLAEELSKVKPKDLCIVGKTETENIGIEKIIKNTITNPSIHTLIITGKDPKGHRSGATLLSLCENSVDVSMRVIGSPGKRPVVKNMTKEEVEAFRSQVKVVDMIGCDDVDRIAGRIREISSGKQLSCSKKEFVRVIQGMEVRPVEIIQAKNQKRLSWMKQVIL